MATFYTKDLLRLRGFGISTALGVHGRDRRDRKRFRKVQHESPSAGPKFTLPTQKEARAGGWGASQPEAVP